MQIKKANFADENFSVSVSKSANEVVATYMKDETGMDLVIRLPPSYPLRPVDVECMRSLGISEVKQRKWLMSMMLFVRNQVNARMLFLFPVTATEILYKLLWCISYGWFRKLCISYADQKLKFLKLSLNVRNTRHILQPLL